jgi:hypothetical protein
MSAASLPPFDGFIRSKDDATSTKITSYNSPVHLIFIRADKWDGCGQLNMAAERGVPPAAATKS